MLLKALKNQNQSRPPVWLMRQAGRYMPTYQALRKKYPLRDLFFTPELAAKITLMPVDQLGVDAAILFSDITVVALPLGYSLNFSEGPVIEKTSKPQDLKSIEKAIKMLKKELKVPLIGFCGGPYTVNSYMGSDPALLKPLTEVTINYVKMQEKAGVDAIQIFDSWANKLRDQEFPIYAEKFLKPIVEACTVPVILFMREANKRVDQLIHLNPSAISFDWEKPLHELRPKVPMCMQGNLNPDILFEPIDIVRKKTKELLASMKGDPGFIVNLGHGIKPKTPYNSVRCMIETVKESAT